MRKQIFLYLFLFTILLLIFQYMNQKSIFETQDKQIENLRAKNEEKSMLLDSFQNQVAELNYFTLTGNENAMTYIENLGYEVHQVENHIRDQIYEKNFDTKNNPLIPYEGMEAGMKINKIKFLNHRWILADFTDGTYWGELLIEFTFDDNGNINFNNLGSLIYPK